MCIICDQYLHVQLQVMLLVALSRASEGCSGCTRVMVHHCTKPKTRQNSIAPICFLPTVFCPLRAAPGRGILPVPAPLRRLASRLVFLFFFGRQKNKKPAFLPIFLASFCVQKNEGYTGGTPRPYPTLCILPCSYDQKHHANAWGQPVPSPLRHAP